MAGETVFCDPPVILRLGYETSPWIYAERRSELSRSRIIRMAKQAEHVFAAIRLIKPVKSGIPKVYRFILIVFL